MKDNAAEDLMCPAEPLQIDGRIDQVQRMVIAQQPLGN
jgi:hypothetical protein